MDIDIRSPVRNYRYATVQENAAVRTGGEPDSFGHEKAPIIDRGWV